MRRGMSAFQIAALLFGFAFVVINILVDIIFKSKGEIYLDTQMFQRRTMASGVLRGRKMASQLRKSRS